MENAWHTAWYVLCSQKMVPIIFSQKKNRSELSISGLSSSTCANGNVSAGRETKKDQGEEGN